MLSTTPKKTGGKKEENVTHENCNFKQIHKGKSFRFIEQESVLTLQMYPLNNNLVKANLSIIKD